jgi:hypothetical protein
MGAMMPTFHDAWVLAALCADQPVDGELAKVSGPLRALAKRLAAAHPEDRPLILEGYSLHPSDRGALVRAIADARPDGPAPPPEADRPARSATLADVRRLMADTSWPWPRWLARGVLNSLASDPGIGKTVLAMTLGAILWFRRPWPDGQANPFPEKTKTLWVAGDRHFAQLLDLATGYGLPDGAVVLNAPDHDPTGGLDLDDPAERDALRRRIEAEAPGLVIVDTVGMTTGLNLCRPEDARDYFGPLMAMASETGTAFLLLTHLSKDAQALGRRIVGASRVVWKLTYPDPDGHPDGRRLWVDKSYGVKPPAQEMTIAEAGCTFALNPPEAAEPRRPGRPSEERDRATKFIRQSLALENDQIGNELCARWEKERGGTNKTFWRAVHDMEGKGELTSDGGKGTGKQTILHLADKTPEP